MSGYPTVESWPSSLPATPLMGNFEEAFPNQVVRSQLDVGPPALRRRSTMTITQMSVTFGLTQAQATTLTVFFETTLVYGTHAFKWYNPRTGCTIAARFIEPPVLNARHFYWYTASLKLETFPYIAP